MERGRKRSDSADQLPADKRPCCPSEPGPSSAPATADCDMESSSSGRSDRTGGAADDSAYGSCDSDPDYDPVHPHYDYDPARPSPAAAAAVSKTKFERIASGLEDQAGAEAQLASLAELCEALSFSMEGTLSNFPTEVVIPSLIRLSGQEGDPEIMLLAVRALTYLCDVMPRSAESLVRHGALPVLCRKLLAIEYVDVAEQCLQALEKISKKQPVPCLHAGTIMAVLTYIDFFSPSAQRVALSTVGNLCKKLPVDCSSLVMEAVPTLCNLLQYEDRKVVETVATCLIRITECFSQSTERLDELCLHGVINRLLDLVAVDGRMSLSQTTSVGLIGLLTKLATNSILAVRTLFELNISSTLRSILMASDVSRGTTYSALQDIQSNQVHEVLKLLNQLIPPASRDVEDIQLVLAKEKILEDEPKFLNQLSADILPVSIQVVNSGANIHTCYGCVSVISNIIYLSPADMLLELLKHTNISSFLAGLLARKDHHMLFLTLKIVDILMQKLPGVYLSSFIKEGVIYAIDSLAMQDNLSQPAAQQSSDSGHRVSARDGSRCLCFAFTSGPPSIDSRTCRLGKDAVLTLTKHIKATYFTNDSETGSTEILQNLKSYSALLNDNVDKCLTDGVCAHSPKEDYIAHILDQIFKELNSGESMSTFEFIESGIMKSLAHYLSNGRYLQPALGYQVSLDHSCAVLTRFQRFAGIILSNVGQTGKDMLFSLLVRKLQDALSCFDNFPVVLSHITRARSVLADIPFRHSTSQPCLKVRFVKEEGEADLSDYNGVLTIELSSSLDVIETYLWPKVSVKDNDHGAEPAGKETNKEADFASGSNGAEEGNQQETHTHASVTEQSSLSVTEVRSMQEHQTLLVTTSAKLRELMSGGASVSDKQLEGSTSSSSPVDEDGHPKLVFALEGKQLDRSTTLYQMILQHQISVEPDLVLGPKFWHDVYKVTYRRAKPSVIPAQVCSDASDVSQTPLFGDKVEFPWHKQSFFSSLVHAELPCKLDKLNPAYDILFMMKVLDGLNRFSCQLCSERNTSLSKMKSSFDDLGAAISAIPQSEFVSSKLTDKLEQQMRDPLVLTTGIMPLWCSQLMAACPFLFSFETRWKYFRLTTFGPSKIQLNQALHSSSTYPDSANAQQSVSGWSHRKKFKVDRSNILESAEKMMASLARSKTAIEVEYNGEVGTGLGPTMEFYTLASHEFQKIGLGMWRGERSSPSHLETGSITGGSEFVVAPLGLFPRPWSSETCVSNEFQYSNVIKKFFLLGQLVAKAIKDGRILDMPFSRAFYKVILQQELGLYDICSFDPELGRTLIEFQDLVNRKKCLGINSDASDLRYRNTSLEDLCLDFTLPGYSDYVLTSEANHEMVNIDNLEEYVKLAVNATIGEGVLRQVESFKSGFNEVFPLEDLQIFTENELERLLCGEGDTWDFSELLDHIKFDHGYTASSTSIVHLLEIIQEFGCEERRAFLQFVTGSPRLPPGGLAALNPKMTIVRKHCSNSPDLDLPSVMTCANYLKLPSYSTKERMRTRLSYAITEGQGSFHLS